MSPTGDPLPTWMWSGTTGSISFNPQVWTSSGTSSTTIDPVPPPTPVARHVSVMADGMLLVDAGWVKIKVPPALFGDLVTLASMGLVEKLAPPEPVTP